MTEQTDKLHDVLRGLYRADTGLTWPDITTMAEYGEGEIAVFEARIAAYCGWIDTRALTCALEKVIELTKLGGTDDTG